MIRYLLIDASRQPPAVLCVAFDLTVGISKQARVFRRLFRCRFQRLSKSGLTAARRLFTCGDPQFYLLVKLPMDAGDEARNCAAHHRVRAPELGRERYIASYIGAAAVGRLRFLTLCFQFADEVNEFAVSTLDTEGSKIVRQAAVAGIEALVDDFSHPGGRALEGDLRRRDGRRGLAFGRRDWGHAVDVHGAPGFGVG